MIFIMNAKGEVTAALPEQVNRGSHNASELILIAPYAGAVRAHIQLPNRAVLEPKSMNMASGKEAPYVHEGDNPFYVYVLPLERPITAVSGTVSVQFFLTLARYEKVTAEGGEETDQLVSYGEITSNNVTFTVNRGVPTVGTSITMGESDLTEIQKIKAALMAAQAAAEDAAKQAQISEENIDNAIKEAINGKFVPDVSQVPGYDYINNNNETVVVHTDDGYVKMKASVAETAKTLPIRDHQGRIQVAYPEYAYHAANKKYVDDADITKISISQSGEGIDGRYTITLERGGKPSLTADIDLPLEAIKIARIEEVEIIDEWGKITDYKLKFHFTDSSIAPLEVNVGDIFSGYVTELQLFDYLSNYVNKDVPTNAGRYVYIGTRNDDGTLATGYQRISSDIDSYSIPIRDDHGGINVPDPKDDTHAVSKKFVEDKTENLMPKPNTLVDKNYSDGTIPSQTVAGLTKYYAVRTNTGGVNDARYSIPLRDVNGCVNTREPVSEFNAVNKGYFDKVTAPIADNTMRIENLESTLLTFIEDNESAYEKDVPVGVGENAIISSIGGATASKNLLDPNRIHADDEYNTRVNDDGSVNYSWDFGDEEHYVSVAPAIELPIGTYYLNYYVKVVGNPNASYTVAFENGTNVMEVAEEGQSVYVVLNILGSGYCSADYYVMLSTDPDAEFESFFDGTNYGKVTAVESYGSNLFDYKQLSSANITQIEDGVKLSTYGNATNITPEMFLAMTGLKEGDTFRYSVKAELPSGDTDPNAGGAQFNIRTGSPHFGFPRTSYATIPSGFNSTNYAPLMLLGLTSGECYLKNITITKGKEVAEYRPYSAEPIDTFTIPQEIQAINGYGKDGFVLDFESKTTEYEDKVTDVSQYLTGYDKFKTIKVQGGGRVRFVNENGLAVPSEITYIRAKE